MSQLIYIVKRGKNAGHSCGLIGTLTLVGVFRRTRPTPATTRTGAASEQKAI